jgi:hypothetical protein
MSGSSDDESAELDQIRQHLERCAAKRLVLQASDQSDNDDDDDDDERVASCAIVGVCASTKPGSTASERNFSKKSSNPEQTRSSIQETSQAHLTTNHLSGFNHKESANQYRREVTEQGPSSPGSSASSSENSFPVLDTAALAELDRLVAAAHDPDLPDRQNGDSVSCMSPTNDESSKEISPTNPGSVRSNDKSRSMLDFVTGSETLFIAGATQYSPRRIG